MNPARATLRFFRATSAFSPRHGGNWGQRFSSPLAPFSFQPLDDISGGFTDPNEVEFHPVYSTAWRARRDRRRSPAKSRAFPSVLPKINDHSLISVADTAEISGSAFA